MPEDPSELDHRLPESYTHFLLRYFLCQLGSLFVFGLGLVAPLTPSEGRPSLPEFAVFLALPVVLSLLPALLVRQPVFLLLSLPTLAIIAAFSWHLRSVWLP